MTRGLWITGAALLAFAVILVVRLPASWVVPAPGKAPAGCMSAEGTLWSGSCSGLIVAGRPLGDLTWQLHPLRLLAGRLAAHVTLAGPALQGSADAEAGLRGHLVARNLDARLPLDPQLLPGLPGGVRGEAQLALPLAEVQGGILTALQGRIELHDLVSPDGPTHLGSYVVDFPAATTGDIAGRVRDLDGPLSVDGMLRLTRQGGFDIQGTVAPRPGAPAELTANLNFLGRPDAAGRREFSLTGTY
ncbi:MAG: type II secretion system protein N [Proteobacteria bacterium]|nr:type II secretion system protein N [Pseudomonadota bacterium]